MNSIFEESTAVGSWLGESGDDEGDFVWQSMLDYWAQTGQLDGFDSWPVSAAGLSQSEFDQLGIYASYGNDLSYQPSAVGRISTGGWT